MQKLQNNRIKILQYKAEQKKKDVSTLYRTSWLFFHDHGFLFHFAV